MTVLRFYCLFIWGQVKCHCFMRIDKRWDYSSNWNKKLPFFMNLATYWRKVWLVCLFGIFVLSVCFAGLRTPLFPKINLIDIREITVMATCDARCTSVHLYPLRSSSKRKYYLDSTLIKENSLFSWYCSHSIKWRTQSKCPTERYSMKEHNPNCLLRKKNNPWPN